MPETATPPAPVAAPAAAPAAPSPKSPVPPVGSPAAHMDAAKKVFAPDPSKAAAPASAEAKPTEAATPAAEAPKTPEILKKADAPAPVAPVVQDFPEDKLPEPATEAAKAGWKELKTITKAERNRAATAEAKLKELEAKQAANPTATGAEEVQRVRTEYDAKLKEYSDRLLVLDLQNHPDFHRQYTGPKKAALDTAKEVIAYNGKEAGAIESLLGKPLKDFNAAVSELTDKMNPADAATVMQSLRQARDIAGQESAALGKAADVHKGLQQQAQQVQRQAFEAVAKETTEIFQKQDVPSTASPDEKAVLEEYNRSVDGLRTAAESRAFGKVTERDVATMAFREAQLTHMVKHGVPILEKCIANQKTVIADLTKQLQALQGGKAPPAGGGGPAQTAQPQNESIEASARRVWQGGT